MTKHVPLMPAADGTKRVAFYCEECQCTHTVRIINGQVKCPRS